MRLDHVSTRVTRCPYTARFRQHGDAKAVAKAYIPTLRSWTESAFFSALDASRGFAERQEILDRFYAAYVAEVVANPDRHGMDQRRDG